VTENGVESPVELARVRAFEHIFHLQHVRRNAVEAIVVGGDLTITAPSEPMAVLPVAGDHTVVAKEPEPDSESGLGGTLSPLEDCETQLDVESAVEIRSDFGEDVEALRESVAQTQTTGVKGVRTQQERRRISEGAGQRCLSLVEPFLLLRP
tara:strand:+ start:684 stop:1139 length:456 start_codon:yes stop_codon:yes gene_type:complete